MKISCHQHRGPSLFCSELLEGIMVPESPNAGNVMPAIDSIGMASRVSSALSVQIRVFICT